MTTVIGMVKILLIDRITRDLMNKYKTQPDPNEFPVGAMRFDGMSKNPSEARNASWRILRCK